MNEKRLYKLINKETGGTIGWFTDSDELFHIIEWYGDTPTKYEEYKLVGEVE